MTQAETLKLLALLKTAYPNFGGDSDPGNVAALWQDMLGDLPARIVALAVRQYVRTNRFPPTVADIRALCAEHTVPDTEAQERCLQSLLLRLEAREA